MQLKVVGGVIVGAAVVAAGAVIAQADGTKAGAAAQTGGLAVENGLVERVAAAGAENMVKVSNRSKEALAITVTRAAVDAVLLRRREPEPPLELRGRRQRERVHARVGESKEVKVTLTTGTASVYGALEIVGLPADIAKRKGVVTGYRIVSALRYKPAHATYALKVGAAKIKAGMVTLSVKSTGNTAEPVTGTVRLKGPLGTRQGSVKSTRLLPGKTIALGAGRPPRACRPGPTRRRSRSSRARSRRR